MKTKIMKTTNLKIGAAAALLLMAIFGLAIFLHIGQAQARTEDCASLNGNSTPEMQKTAKKEKEERETLFQVAPLKALSEGIFEGDTPMSEVMRHGDFGTGTLNRIDSEGIMLDGEAWTIGNDGKARRVAPNELTPFATVTFFDLDQRIQINTVSNFADFGKQLDARLSSLNLIHAVRIDGEFEFVRARSIPIQKRPFPRAAEVLKQQAVFEFEKVRGSMVGFRFPAFMNGLDAPGYHLHFITANRKSGGHVLDFRMRNATVQIDETDRFTMRLQRTPDFLKADLSNTEANELQNLVQPKPPQ
jgi:acetolactate decarboxylase